MRVVLTSFMIFGTVCACDTPAEPLTSLNQPDVNHGFDHEYIDALENHLTAGFESFGRVPGMVVVVVQRGFEPHIITLGDLTDEHYLPIASLTKSFTGLTAARLHLEGRINLDAFLIDAWPQIAFSGEVDLANVRVRDLLTHSNGLINPGMDHRLLFSGLTSETELATAIEHTQNNVGAPAGSYSYSNLGYNLFAQYLEDAHQMSWIDEVTLTAQMAGASSFTLSPSSIVDERYANAFYGAGQDGVQAMDYRREDYNTTAAGGGFLTAQDMGNWISAWQDPTAAPQLAEAIEMASQVQFERNSGQEPVLFDGYGLGWFVGSFRGRAYLQHGGGFFGTSTYAAVLADDGFAVFAMANEYPLSPALTGFAGRSALDLWLADEGVELPTPASLAQTAQMGVNYFADRAAEIYGESWQLTLNRGAYTGQFDHPAYGTLRIFQDNGELYASIGALCTPLAPGENGDSLAGDLIPFNHEIYEFEISDERTISLAYRDAVFVRSSDIAHGIEPACPR